MESRGRFAEAIDAYTKASVQRPNDCQTYYDRGVAFGRLNSWKEATDDYSWAIEHDPESRGPSTTGPRRTPNNQLRGPSRISRSDRLDPRAG